MMKIKSDNTNKTERDKTGRQKDQTDQASCYINWMTNILNLKNYKKPIKY